MNRWNMTTVLVLVLMFIMTHLAFGQDETAPAETVDPVVEMYGTDDPSYAEVETLVNGKLANGTEEAMTEANAVAEDALERFGGWRYFLLKADVVSANHGGYDTAEGKMARLRWVIMKGTADKYDGRRVEAEVLRILDDMADSLPAETSEFDRRWAALGLLDKGTVTFVASAAIVCKAHPDRFLERMRTMEDLSGVISQIEYSAGSARAVEDAFIRLPWLRIGTTRGIAICNVMIMAVTPFDETADLVNMARDKKKLLKELQADGMP